MKMYRTGLVVGKFCPLHIGHEFLIETALENCVEVVVLSYTSQKFPKCDVENRKKWLEDLAKRLHAQDRLKIYVIDPKETKIPDDFDDDQTHREFCGSYLLNVIETTVQAVFSSESYGKGFSDYLSAFFTVNFKNPINVHNFVVDMDREKYQISGTMLRDNPKLIWDYCQNIVINSYIPKILFLGGESSGKSTITEALAKHFDTEYTLEFGRSWFDKMNGLLKYEDMEYIAKKQVTIENNQVDFSEKFLFCDTSALTTSFYSKEWFGRVSKKLQKLVDESMTRYDKIYVCMPDFPMVQDGTRQDEKFRLKGFEFVVNYLESAGVKYSLLGGSEEERMQRVIKELDSQSNFVL